MAFTLATFNVKDLFLPRNDLERFVYPQKIANVAALLARADADVVGLQEIGARDALREIVASIASAQSRAPYAEIVLGAVDKRGIGNALLARVPVVARETHAAARLDLPVFVRGDSPPFGARIPLRRAVVHTVVDGGAGIGHLHVFVCHFKSKLPSPLRDESGGLVQATTARARAEADLRSLFFRAAEALYVRGLVDDVLARDAKAHVAVVGDFNDTLEGIAPRLVAASGHRATEALVGALYACRGTIADDRRFTVLHAGVPEQIDHVLVTAALRDRVQDAWILNEALRDHGPLVDGAPPEPDSDHAPFVVRFA